MPPAAQSSSLAQGMSRSVSSRVEPWSIHREPSVTREPFLTSWWRFSSGSWRYPVRLQRRPGSRPRAGTGPRHRERMLRGESSPLADGAPPTGVIAPTRGDVGTAEPSATDRCRSLRPRRGNVLPRRGVGHGMEALVALTAYRRVHAGPLLDRAAGSRSWLRPSRPTSRALATLSCDLNSGEVHVLGDTLNFGPPHGRTRPVGQLLIESASAAAARAVYVAWIERVT